MSSETVKVLLVENDRGDAALLRRSLAAARTAKFELVHVETLSDALKQVAAGAFDIVLLDLGLPDSEGLDTFVRAHEDARGLPIVVLTGLDDETAAIQAVQAGAQDYLVKGQVEGPSLVRALLYAIERLRRDQADALRKTQTIHLFRSLFRTLGRGASAVLYLAGVDAGTGTFEFIRETWKPADERRFLEALTDYFRSAGLCTIQDVNVDRSASRVTARVQDSFESATRGRDADAFVCHFLRGILCGIAIQMLGVSELVGDEITCQSHGGKACEFLVHPLFG